MANKIQNGKFTAKIIDYGIGVTKNGDPQALVQFKFKDDDGDSHDITWFGSFKAKAQEWTCKSLVLLGFRGDSPTVLSGGPSSNCLNIDKEVSIVIGHETYNDKEIARVKFINEVGGSAFQNKLTNVEADLKFDGMNLGGVFAEARQKSRQPSTLPNEAPGFDTEEEIPF